MLLEAQAHPEKRDVWVLLIDGEPWIEVAKKIFKFPKKLHFEAETGEKLEEHFFAMEYEQARRYCLFLLSIKNYPGFGLDEILAEKLVSGKTRVRVIEHLEAQGYIDDDNWVRNFIDSLRRKNYGPRLILQKIKFKKVPLELVEKHFSGVGEQEEQKRQIAGLLESKYGRKNLQDYRERQKVIAGLMRKGFSYEAIREALVVRNIYTQVNSKFGFSTALKPRG